MCGISTNYVWRLKYSEDNISQWYRCTCGVAFQEEYPSLKVYDKKYIKEYNDKHTQKLLKHYVHTYAPLIEETVYGRKMLDVGFGGKVIMNEMERRGWLTWGIDSNKVICGHDNIYKGDFEEYDFKPNVSKEALEKELGKEAIVDLKIEYDLIWCSNTFACFKDPVKALKKMYELLNEEGTLFLTVPDIDFITTCGIGAFPGFKKDEYHTLWNKTSIVRELERIGFNVIMAKRNFKNSYINHYDVHIIAQKKYF